MGNSGSITGLSAYDDGGGYHPHHPHHHHHQHHLQQHHSHASGTAGYHQHHQRYHDAMRGGAVDGGPGWLESYHQQRQEQQQQQRQDQQQIKVLPDIPGKVAKLRSTNNGNILHAGGTISKNNQLQRSKSISSPNYQQHHRATIDESLEIGAGGELMCSLPPRMLMTRSRTQVSMLGPTGSPTRYDEDTVALRARPPQFPGVRSATHQPPPPASYQQSGTGAGAGGGAGQRKRFGSEPDLRAPHDQPKAHGEGGGQTPGGLLRTPKTAQSKIMKGKNKKKAAPVPPIPLEKQKDAGKREGGDRGGRIIAYSPLRKTNSDTSSTLPSSSTEQSGGGGGRKLRLFKTRAETRKQPIIAKLPEASDAKFAAKVQQNGATGPVLSSATPTSLKVPGGGAAGLGRGTSTSAGPSDRTMDRVVLEQLPTQPNPRSFFRREKTFDVGLLSLEARKAARYQLEPAKPTLSPPLSRRKSIVKSLLEAEPQSQQQDQENEKRRNAAGVTPRQDSGQQQQQARRKPSQMHPLQGGPGAGKEGEAVRESRYPVPRPSHPGKGAPNTLVIPVEPADVAVTAPNRDSLPPPTALPAPTPSPPPPPPPPPLPKSSFYFGMSTGAPNGAGSPASTPDGGVAQHDGGPELDREATEEEEEEGQQNQEKLEPADRMVRAGSLDEIDRTQMDIIDRFAASLLQDSRRFHSTDSVASSEADLRGAGGHLSPTDDASAADGQEIALRLRPTLPRKQFDIPRFSPAAAWRLLTTEDEFESGGGDKKQPTSYLRGTELDGASSEDRIERVYREPGLPGMQDNKSGDSGISGDAEGLPDLGEPVAGHQHRRQGGGKGDRQETSPDSSPLMGSSAEEKGDGVGDVDDSGDGRPTNNNNNSNGWSSSALTRLTPWTPQQDLEDDDDTTTGGSSSDHQHHHQHEHRLRHLQLDDSGIDHHQHRHHNDFATKGHLFSLSLPRENHLSIYTGGSADDKIEKHVFNSLQKLRKSVSDAFRSDETTGPVGSNDNWFLGRLGDTKTRTPAMTVGVLGGSYDKRASGQDHHAEAAQDHHRETDTTPLRSHKITSSSIGYLVSGRHVMYLPKEPTRLLAPMAAAAPAAPLPASAKHADHNNNSHSIGNRNGGGAWESSQQQQQHQHQQHQQQHQQSVAPSSPHGTKMSAARIRGQASERQQVGPGCPVKPHALPPHENKENLQDTVPVVVAGSTGAGAGAGELAPDLAPGTSLPVKLSNRRHHRFTFQSTIRQIEKRRVAEKLSREAEIKEAMRLSELEAMRRVEEEFQRKRAREKASIRHQLRLFSMDDGAHQFQQQNGGYGDDSDDDNNDGHHPGSEESRPYDGKRSDPDGDSLPHQSAKPGRGLYRKRDSSTIERQQQYKRSITQEGTGYPYHAKIGDGCDGNDDDDGDVVVGENGADAQPDHDNDGDSSSSLGYVDTRTPYISRIIQAKSSKSGYGLHKLRAD
ncbi:uncharacterized protein LOC118463287 [Anopheles albimanus]|uniref:Uncharacterized protein n=1 Tax=Anopheles albimanus TaxID=7167 RepID=A0A182F9Y8_ANOAL|nr:uncharacterized protein LOC118463287 [Anopheles albimanus]XP_035785783.1 uncharacterized protein LOC118463287 [Anopheles albimanus]